MSRIVNPVVIRPDELMHGDVLVVTVALHIIKCKDGYTFRAYRCDYPPQKADGIPQGNRLGTFEGEVMQELFPVVYWAGIQPDV